MTAYSGSEWSELFVAGAGASAALAGLVFVAVSINIERILEYRGLPERALETVLLLLSVVVVSLFGLAPGQIRTALGAELLGEALLFAGAIGWLIARGLPPAGEASYLRSRIGLVAPGTLAFVIGGASMLAGVGGGLYWLAGMIGAIAGAVLNAWVLLVEILR